MPWGQPSWWRTWVSAPVSCLSKGQFYFFFSLYGSIDCSPPGSSVHGNSQARMLEWVAISFSRGSSQPKGQIHVSRTGKQVPYHCTTWEARPLS